MAGIAAGHAARMTDEKRDKEELEDDELEETEGELLPDREEMMLVDPTTGESLLGPPDLADPNA